MTHSTPERRKTGRPLSRSAALFGAIAMGSTGAAAAAPAKVEAQRAAVLKAITDCRTLESPEARVACYDKAVDQFTAAEAKGQVIVVDREQAQAVRRQSFGFNIPSIAIFSKAAKPEELDRITLQLRGAHQGGDGKWVLISTDNAVWRQTDDQALALDPHAGSSLSIRSGVLGSFFCSLDRQPEIRCLRDR